MKNWEKYARELAKELADIGDDWLMSKACINPDKSACKGCPAWLRRCLLSREWLNQEAKEDEK